jgi:hypothetical protein
MKHAFFRRQMFGSMQPGDSERRSIYVRVARNAIDPLLRVFDFPEPASAVGCRDVTNVPAQALYLLNDKRITDLAWKWAEQILADSSLATDDDRLQRMFISAIGRSASPDELSRTRQLLMSTQQETADSASRLASIRAEQAAQTSAVAEVLDAARARLSAAMTEEQLFESLEPSERQRVVAARTHLEQLQAVAASLVEKTGEKAISDPRLAGWTEVGRAIFLLKEFIYLR